MFEFQLTTEMGRKAEFFVFRSDCLEHVGALDVGELRELTARGGIDPFLAGWVIGFARHSMVGDQGRLFLVPEEVRVGCMEFPNPRPGFAAEFDRKRAAFARGTTARGACHGNGG